MPLFPFFFPFPFVSSDSASASILEAPLADGGPHGFEELAGLLPISLLTILPLPYPKIVLWGLAAGGRAGKASAPDLTFLDAGREVGGVGRAEPGFEPDVEGAAAQDIVLTFVDLASGRVVGGKLGNALTTLEVDGEDAVEDVPQDRAWET